jgi:hypothetical protein
MQRTYGSVLFALLALVACGNSTRATGEVRDTHGRPVPGVIVRLEIGGAAARTATDDSGRYFVAQAHDEAKTPADLTYCRAGYYLGRRWFDDSRSIPQVLNVTIREIDTTASPARAASAQAPCAALGVAASGVKSDSLVKR